DITKGHKAEQPISLNIIANVLGLGWAATPAGLEAMKELSELEKERNYNISNGSRGDRKRSVGNDIASNEMCDFLILNISSLQLIPVTMIAYRTQYGSEDPTAIIAPAIVATFCSTLAAIIFCKLMRMGNR
ncbi:MAG: nucleoside recognition protein, partial [Lachnospiraceae bacterium]|nr:nucleoside recognition protein [Lachnospiraceae bacterium]